MREFSCRKSPTHSIFILSKNRPAGRFLHCVRLNPRTPIAYSVNWKVERICFCVEVSADLLSFSVSEFPVAKSRVYILEPLFTIIPYKLTIP